MKYVWHITFKKYVVKVLFKNLFLKQKKQNMLSMIFYHMLFSKTSKKMQWECGKFVGSLMIFM